jgi:hypothetical protein
MSARSYDVEINATDPRMASNVELLNYELD